MKKILHLGEPPIKTNQSETLMLSILSTYDSFTPWFIYNFTQIRVNNVGSLFFNLIGSFNCPFLFFYMTHKNTLNKYETIVEYVKECIDDGMYVVIVVNCYYIKQYAAFHNNHIDHSLFVYGYDDVKRELYVSDFFKTVYSHGIVSYCEMDEAFENALGGFWWEGAMAIKKREYIQLFDIGHYSALLTRYLTGNEPACVYDHLYNGGSSEYGLDSLYKRLDLAIETAIKKENIEMCTFATFSDHKIVLYTAVKYLHEQYGEAFNKYVGIFEAHMDKSIKLRNQIIKLIMTGKAHAISKQDFANMREDERKYLSDLINTINDYIKSFKNVQTL